MSEQRGMSIDSLPLSRARRIDEICARFEDAWIAGRRPVIEDYLGDTPEPERSALLRELIGVEIHYHRQSGEDRQLADYRARFPALDATWLAQAIVSRVAIAAGPQAREAALLFRPGIQVGECRIERLLGRGGMGEVYLAEHQVLGCQVAVKVLPACLAHDLPAAQRFRKSVQILARLKPHAHIAAALHASIHQDRLYLVMEYVPGEDLKTYVQRLGPLPPDKACALIRQTAAGLAYAHQHGIVHRDIKPANLMLTPEGTIKILDLGLARLVTPQVAATESTQTEPGVAMGTLDYMAPEQARDARCADARSDLYSLGCTFYFLLTGRPPFTGRSQLETVTAHALEAPPAVQQVRPDVPAAVADVVQKLLAKQPHERFSSAAALLEALSAAASQGMAARVWRPEKIHRRRTWVLGVAAVLVVAALGSGWLWAPWFRQSPSSSLSPRWPVAVSPRLQELILAIERSDDGNGETRGETHGLVVQGREAEFGRLAPLGPKDTFRLEGEFQQPTYWYVLWFDTAGVMKVEECSPERRPKLEFPADPVENMVSVNPADPAGVHLLLLVAGSVPPNIAEPQLTAQLGGVGKPPFQEPPPATHLLRGAGARVASKTPLASDYLKQLQDNMPTGLEAVYALFLQTVK